MSNNDNMSNNKFDTWVSELEEQKKLRLLAPKFTNVELNQKKND